MEQFIDYYNILGVSPKATQQEIHKAYRRIANACHPDKTANMKEEEKKKRLEYFKKANDAYSLLKDEEKRAEYNKLYIVYIEKIREERRKRQEARIEEMKRQEARQEKLRQQQERLVRERIFRKEQEKFIREEALKKEQERLEREEKLRQAREKLAREEALRKEQEKKSEEATRKEEETKQVKEDFIKYQQEEPKVSINKTAKKKSSRNIGKRIKKSFINAYKEEKIKEGIEELRFQIYKDIMKTEFENVTFVDKGFVIFTEELKRQQYKLNPKHSKNIYNYTMANRKIFATLLLVGITAGMVASYSSEKEVKAEQIPTVLDTMNNDDSVVVNRMYTVTSGDSLSELAEEASCTTEEIKEMNNLKDSTIYLNESLEIPYHISEEDLATYTTTSAYTGEDLTTYAANYQTDVESLINLNKDTIKETDQGYVVTADTLQTPNFTSNNDVFVKTR